MKKPLWTGWRWLLALLLGIGSWWGISWWLSPRTPYVLRFPIHETDAEWRRIQISSMWFTEERRLRGFTLRPFDSDGRYFLLEVPVGDARDKVRYEVRETANGNLVTAFDPTQDQHFEDFVSAMQAGRDFAPDGSIHVIESGHLDQSVWNINVLSGERRRLGLVPAAGRSYLSDNGSTLLIIDDIPALDFLALAPLPPLPAATLVALARSEGHYEKSGGQLSHPFWRRLRVYSLPDRSDRFTVWLPPILTWKATFRGDDYRLSHDGTWLLYADQPFPRQNFSSPSVQPGASTESLILVNCRTGMSSSIPLPTGLVIDGLEYAPAGFQGVRVVDHNSPSYRRNAQGYATKTIYFHLDTRNWFIPAGDGFGMPAHVGGGIFRYVLSDFSQEMVIHIVEASPKGDTTKLATLPANSFSMATHQLIPEHPWMVITNDNPYRRPPVALSWLGKVPYFRSLLSSPTGTTLYDYSAGRVLWHTTHADRNSYVVITPNNLVETHRDNGYHVVNALTLRMAWSPWWSRAAGLLVAALVLLARRPNVHFARRLATQQPSARITP